MSSIGYPAALRTPRTIELPSLPTRLRLTRRGRRVIAVLLAVVAAVVVLLALLGGAGAATAGGAAGAPLPTLTVDAGDTLWSIAEEIAPGADPRGVIYELKKLNGLPSAAVSPGQVLSIPAVYAR